MLQPYAIERFGGLWMDDPEEGGPTRAIDLQNVHFDHEGRVRSRAGYTKWINGLAAAPSAVVPWS
jgi:hypothetical protein